MLFRVIENSTKFDGTSIQPSHLLIELNTSSYSFLERYTNISPNIRIDGVVRESDKVQVLNYIFNLSIMSNRLWTAGVIFWFRRTIKDVYENAP